MQIKPTKIIVKILTFSLLALLYLYSYATYAYSLPVLAELTVNESETPLCSLLKHSDHEAGKAEEAGVYLYPKGYKSDTLHILGLDDDNRIETITNTSQANLSQALGYDELDRLTSYSGNTTAQSYTYDDDHNRQTDTINGNTTTYTYAATSNQLDNLTGATSATLTHNATGHITNDGTHTYQYDARERLISIDNGKATYLINTLGQRLKKTIKTGSGRLQRTETTYFAYDEAGHLIGEYDDKNQAIQEIVWLNDTPIAAIKPNLKGEPTLYYIHTDHLNTPRQITNPKNNKVVWRWDSDPFGTTQPNEDPDGDKIKFTFNLRFPGQYFDKETGLFYNWQRFLDPTKGRYLQSDPIGLQGGINTYGYVNGNPVSFSDPNGLEPTDPLTGHPVGRFIVDSAGNTMIEPVGGGTIAIPRPGGPDTHTLYPNGSNYQRLNPQGHGKNTTPHAHGHLVGAGPGKGGQGPSISVDGKVVKQNSTAAHWAIKPRTTLGCFGAISSVFGFVVDSIELKRQEQCLQDFNCFCKQNPGVCA